MKFFFLDFVWLKKLDASDPCLHTSYLNMEASLRNGMPSHIFGGNLSMELMIFRINTFESSKVYRNTYFFWKNGGLLTIPILDVTAGRSFSKLKLIKNYLWSTMSQEKLNGLAMLLIETNTSKRFDSMSFFIKRFAFFNVDSLWYYSYDMRKII